MEATWLKPVLRTKKAYNRNMKLLSEAELESSCIVANNRMNRERVALGSNGYETDLQFDPIEYLIEKYESQQRVGWLDLCCGRGKALIETGQHFLRLGISANVNFVGVDLVGMFDPLPDELDFIALIEASLSQWRTPQTFDLITCVHGIHYVGDKLGLVSRALSMLNPNGLFSANLDENNLRLLASDHHKGDVEFNFAERLRVEYVSDSFEFDPTYNLLRLTSDSQANVQSLLTMLAQVEFAGADDQAGPNYTGQEAVNSYYRVKNGVDN